MSFIKKTVKGLGWVVLGGAIFLFLTVFVSAWPWLVIAGVVYIVYWQRNTLLAWAGQNSNLSKAVLSFTTVLVLLSVIEIVFRANGTWGWQEYNYTWWQRLAYTNYAPFQTLFVNEDEGWLHILKFGKGEKVVDCNPEYCHTATVNSQGCNDTEWPRVKSKRWRIACLGDSFTEGLGATPDSTYEKIWQTLDTTIEVMNCGIRGSDPCYEFMLLNERIFAYRPDVVVMSVNNSDFSDLVDRGGFERFKQNGTVASEKRPWWYPVYGCSYIARMVVHNALKLDYSLLTPHQKALATQKAYADLKTAIDTTAAACRKRSIPLVVNFHPTVQEFTIRKTMELDSLMNNLDTTRIKVIDMHRYFLDSNVDSANAGQYYWPHDGHHNNRGYALMAQGLHHYIH